MTRTSILFTLAVVAFTTTASADPEVATTEPRGSGAPEVTPPPPPPTPPPRGRDVTAADVANAPLPGFESGRLDELDSDSTLRVIGRGALFPPKILADVALWPIHGALWANERYDLENLYYRTFFNADRTIGLFPTAAYESGYGLSAGAGFVHRDVFGEHERLSLQATSGVVVGVTSIVDTRGSFRTGDRLGWLELGIEGNYDHRPGRDFYGIGNGDLTVAGATPIDPRTNETAVQARYSYQETRGLVFADARLVGALHLRTTGALTDLAFGRGDRGVAIDDAYDPTGLVGFGGVRHAYGELALRYDQRHRATTWEPNGLYSRGLLATAFAGRVHRLDSGTDFWRYGFEAQQFLRLGIGPRVLVVRVHGDAVSGTRGEVPFTELPALGGQEFLRGYPFERFRDRVAALGTVEYDWDLSHLLAASVFVDAGRVFPSLGDLGVDHLRVGYGAALALYKGSGFLLQGSLASSIDGGLFLSVAFNPVFDARPRWR